jgi:hypothetical protein
VLARGREQRFGGREPVAAAPARQRLVADDLPVAKVDDRLVDRLDVGCIERRHQRTGFRFASHL